MEKSLSSVCVGREKEGRGLDGEGGLLEQSLSLFTQDVFNRRSWGKQGGGEGEREERGGLERFNLEKKMVNGGGGDIGDSSEKRAGGNELGDGGRSQYSPSVFNQSQRSTLSQPIKI